MSESWKKSFHVDEANSDEQYLYVDSAHGTIAIKLEDEGIVVDLFPLQVSDAPVASTWATYDELKPKQEG